MKALKLFLNIISILILSNAQFSDNYHCSTFNFEKCNSYNITFLPNYQNETSIDIIKANYFNHLRQRKKNCGKSFELFLCAFHFPVCSDGKKVGPCKSFCKQVISDCIENENTEDYYRYCEPLDNKLCINDFYKNELCPESLQVPTNLEYKIVLNNETVVKNCGFPCRRNLFENLVPENFIKSWIGFWSCLCTLSTLFTVFTFLINMKRFQYPERPIIYLSACYLVVSIAYIIGISLDNKATCTGPFKEFENSTEILIQGTKHEACIIFFMVIYFFTMSGIAWWVVLTITWYLAAKCHWAHEAIARHAQYWHFAAWAFPAGQTIGILAWGKIDADPYSGVCYTGLTDSLTLKIFIIAPMLVYLMIGNCFLITGFISLFRIRKTFRQLGKKTEDLEKFIRRIGIFSLFYIIPAFFLIFCHTYEAFTIEERTIRWYRQQVCPLIKESSRPSICHVPLTLEVDEVNRISSSPSDWWNNSMTDFLVMMLKYLMKFIVGITIGIWTWSGKTLIVWRQFLSRSSVNTTTTMNHRELTANFGGHQQGGGQETQWPLQQDHHQQMKNLSIL